MDTSSPKRVFAATQWTASGFGALRSASAHHRPRDVPTIACMNTSPDDAVSSSPRSTVATSNLFAHVTPRPEVLTGELTEAMFAASLEDVVSRQTSDAYADPATFFAATHPSAGLRTLLNEALGRLSGRHTGAASVIRLETSLGGGKTHNLIALYYAAQGKLAPGVAGEFCTVGLLPREPVNVGVFVGTGSGAQSFPVVNGIAARTVWGYLAAQIGGAQGYELLAADDQAATAPGAEALRALFAGGPTLIMIDEIARYYRTASGVGVGTGTLAGQTTAFLMALAEAVDNSPRAVLVLTTTATTDAFGEDTAQVLAALGEMQSILARKELVLRPSEEADLPRILSRRLFAPIAPGLSTTVGAAYAEAADVAVAAGLELPEAMTGVGGFGNQVASSYPFHPSLIAVLDKRLSTIPNFQRTRGALRLLARAVRRLWQEQPSDAQVIHLHHVDLSDGAIAEELSSRIDRAAYEPVIRADVAAGRGGSASHAEQVDLRMGGVPYARRLATTIYLYSLTRDTPGITAAMAYGAVLAPGTDTNVLQRALQQLDFSCWYLHSDDLRGLRFSTEPSLVKLIQQAEAAIAPGKVVERATQILSEQYRDGAFKVRRSWMNSQVPDNADDLWLMVTHWDDFGDAHGIDPRSPVPTSLQDLWERTTAGGKREFRNRLVIAAPNAAGHASMLSAVKQHLALVALSTNTDQLSGLGPEKTKELNDRAKQSQLLARVAVCNHVNVLYVPRQGRLETVELPAVSTASVPPNQSDAVLDQLASMGKLLRAGDSVLDPAFVKDKLGAMLQQRQPTAELIRVFARRTDLPMVLDRDQLVALVGAGVRNATWEYHDAERGESGWSTAAHSSGSYRLSEDAFLAPVGSAPPPAPVLCPFCHTAHAGGLCPPKQTGGSVSEEPFSATPGSLLSAPLSPSTAVAPLGAPDRLAVARPRHFTASGSAAGALTDARKAATDSGRVMLVELTGGIERTGTDAGKDLARLYSVVGPTTSGVRLTYDVAIEMDPSASCVLSLHYRGTPGDYAPLREAIRQALSSRSAVVQARFEAVFDPPWELSGDLVGRLVQAAADTGPAAPCDIEITTEGDAI